MDSPPIEPFFKDLEVDTEPIEDVRAATRSFFWKRHRTFSLVLFGCLAVMEIFFAILILPVLYAEGATRDTIQALCFVLLFPIGCCVFLWIYAQGKIQSTYMRQLAASLGYTYARSADISTVSGQIFTFGHAQMLADVFSGTYRTLPTRFFTYYFTMGSGKHTRLVSTNVWELDTGKTLPEIIVKSKSGMFQESPGEIEWMPPGGERLSLEGNFDTYFDVYIPKGTQIPALQVLEPTILNQLITSFAGYGTETHGTKLYVFTNKINTLNKAQFLAGLALIDALFDTLAPELANVST